NLLAHQYAYEELLGNYRLYKTVKDANQQAQIKSGGAVPFAAKPGPKRQMIAGPATPSLQLYIEGVQRDISHINLLPPVPHEGTLPQRILRDGRDFSSPPPDSNHPYLPPHHPELPRPAPSRPDPYRPRPSPHNPSPYRVSHHAR
ncbi:hypothetical protein PROFUN_16645, partial [Planoprotostelium fungivorum]